MLRLRLSLAALWLLVAPARALRHKSGGGGWSELNADAVSSPLQPPPPALPYNGGPVFTQPATVYCVYYGFADESDPKVGALGGGSGTRSDP